MSAAPRYTPHYTVEDYMLWEGDWELWSGIAVAMTPSPFGPHERFVSQAVRMLLNQIDQQECDCSVYSGLDWIVNRDTVVRPDVMVVCGDQPQRHLERAPELVIEVLSAATATKDRTAKRELYQSCGVAWFLLVDPAAQTIEGFRLVDGGYCEVPLHSRTPEAAAGIRLPGGCTFQLEHERLFR